VSCDRKDLKEMRGPPPDPGEKGARFLGWIKKRGFFATFEECDAYCSSIGLDLIKFAKSMGHDRLIVGRTSHGTVAAKIIDRRWASQWARYYECDLPHHSHKMKL
jgi:hypothetical protein